MISEFDAFIKGNIPAAWLDLEKVRNFDAIGFRNFSNFLSITNPLSIRHELNLLK